MEIPGRREGSNEKTFHGGGMDIFWNHTFTGQNDVVETNKFLTTLRRTIS